MTVLAALNDAIANRFGLARRPPSPDPFERATKELARQLALPLPELAARVEQDPELSRRLAGHLTVDESYFLRQPEHFDLVLERIGRDPADTIGRPLTVLSAGCAHGEEPYSLAILVAERAPWARPFVRILASDLSRASILQAREGRFSDWSMRDAPDWFRSRYFQHEGDGWRIDPAIRAMVGFEHLSILEHVASLRDRSIDVVLFRNVAIYLEPAALERIYEGFARILTDDGLLILGASDPAPSRTLFTLRAERSGSSYRRALAPAAAPAAATVASRMPARTSRATSAPPAFPSLEARGLYEQARRLGDRGASEPALELAEKVIATAPLWSAGYQLRAMLRLSLARHREALADLRQAAYLAPEELLPRFLCATALRAAGQLEQSRAEARALVARLKLKPPSALIEDGCTSAGELLGAALELLEERA